MNIDDLTDMFEISEEQNETLDLLAQMVTLATLTFERNIVWFSNTNGLRGKINQSGNISLYPSER